MTGSTRASHHPPSGSGSHPGPVFFAPSALSARRGSLLDAAVRRMARSAPRGLPPCSVRRTPRPRVRTHAGGLLALGGPETARERVQRPPSASAGRLLAGKESPSHFSDTRAGGLLASALRRRTRSASSVSLGRPPPCQVRHRRATSPTRARAAFWQRTRGREPAAPAPDSSGWFIEGEHRRPRSAGLGGIPEKPRLQRPPAPNGAIARERAANASRRFGGEAFLKGDCGAGRRSEATQDARRSSAGRSCEGTTAWTGVVSGGRLRPERGLPACGTGARKECPAADAG